MGQQPVPERVPVRARVPVREQEPQQAREPEPQMQGQLGAGRHRRRLADLAQRQPAGCPDQSPDRHLRLMGQQPGPEREPPQARGPVREQEPPQARGV